MLVDTSGQWVQKISPIQRVVWDASISARHPRNNYNRSIFRMSDPSTTPLVAFSQV